MFWNKKWKELTEWMRLQGEIHNDFLKITDDLQTQIDLILNHLNLEYIPETEKKEPAKLVEKSSNFIASSDWGSSNFIASSDWGIVGGDLVTDTSYPEYKPKKKRGRPKKKK